MRIEKYNPRKIFTVVYFDAEQQYFYVKRFPSEPSEKSQRFIDEHPDSYITI